ncbi:MAG: AMP-binding protein [Desulfovibrio sp.]|jgi:phenylacetate-coenzyme A ligase PaaK-like adenylate-forming protein|nr:AMP-binding protein [Desulfovibrio sp.]
MTLREAQQTSLHRLLPYAARQSRFYARRLADVDLDSIELANFESLPFTTAGDLRNWRDFLCVPPGEVQRMVSLHATSGTTGDPKRLAFTQNDLARTCDFFREGMRYLVKPGERLAVALPGADRPDGVADLLRRALRPLEVEVFCPNAREDLVPWLCGERIHCLITFPTPLACLLRAFPAAAPPTLRGVLNSGDRLDPELKAAVRAAWKCEVLDHYGLTETAFGCAVECPAHNGCHIRALDVLIEIVDVRTGAPLPPGHQGEIVVTTLRHEAMPLIRYRTGDVGSLMPEGRCACGNYMPRLGPVLGRLDRTGGQARLVRTPKGGS